MGMRSGHGIRSGECKRDENHSLPHYSRSVSRQSTCDTFKTNGVLPNSGKSLKSGKTSKRHKKTLSQCSDEQLPSPKGSESGDSASHNGSMNSAPDNGLSHPSTIETVDTNGQIERARVKAMETYRGEWKNDKRHGYGIMNCSDHFNYTGQWHENLRHGFGLATLPDGTKLEGEWEQDMLTCDIKKKGPLISLVTRLKHRLQISCEAAQHAAEVADQKSKIALSRAAAARDRSADATIVAEHAKEAADTARRRARAWIAKLPNNT